MNLPPYPKYKASGLPWLGDVPEHWNVDRLKWMTTGTANGIWGDDPNGIDDVICIRVADFERDKLRVVDDPSTLRSVDLSQRRGRILKRGDLLIEKSGGGEKQLVGYVVLFDRDFEAVCSNFIARLPVRCGNWPRYWAYSLASLYAGRLNYPAVKQTTGIQNLDAEQYLATRVAHPPDEEQRAIAEFLDRETSIIDTLVAKKRTLIERLQEKRAALISRTVTRGLPTDAARAAGLDPHPKLKPSGHDWLGDIPEHWRMKRVGDESAFISYGFTNPMPTTAEGPFMITANDINGERVMFEAARSTSCEAFDLLTPKSKPHRRDILITKDGTLGRIAVVDSDEPFCINQSVALLRPKSSSNERLLSAILQSPPYFDRILFEAGGTTIKHIYITRLARMPIAIPPELEQTAIVNFLHEETGRLDQMITKVETAVECLNEYRSALISAAVTGKIDVRGGVE